MLRETRGLSEADRRSAMLVDENAKNKLKNRWWLIHFHNESCAAIRATHSHIKAPMSQRLSLQVKVRLEALKMVFMIEFSRSKCCLQGADETLFFLGNFKSYC